MKLTPEQKGYIAGIIDGEGCLYYNPRKSPRAKNNVMKPRSEDRNVNGFCPVLNIANTDPRMLEKVQSLVGGTTHSVIPKREGWKTRHLLLVHANALRELLPQIIDLLIIKKEQATLMLKWFDLFSDRSFRKFKYQRLEIQNLFWKYSKLLNHKGGSELGEFREHLSQEAILSQALREIEEKVQRLGDEAKEIGKERILEAIKSLNPVKHSDLMKSISSLDRVTAVSSISELEAAGLVVLRQNRTQRKPSTYYFYAGNSPTSAQRGGTTHRDDIVRAA